MSTFGERLRAIRQAQGLSQQAAAGKLGIGQTTLSALERRKMYPRQAVVDKLAQGYGVTTSQLLGTE